MTSSRFSTIVRDLQSDIIDILKADTTTFSITLSEGGDQDASLSQFTILDGMPTDLIKGTGFPYIIVHTPTEETFKKTLNTKYQSNLEIQIEVYDRRESCVRTLIDMVRSSVLNGIATWRARDMFMMPMDTRIHSTSPKVSYLPMDRTKPVWYMSIFIPFKWSGIV